MNARNLFGMDGINRFLNFLSWSISLHFLLTINLLILHKVLPKVLLFLPDPCFLSVIFPFLNTFILRSAHWNMMIPSIWAISNVLTYLTISALQISGSFSNFGPERRFKKHDSHLREYNIFLYKLL